MGNSTIPQSAVNKLWARTAPSGDCLLWQGAVGKNGYGIIWVRSEDGTERWLLVHRLAYLATKGSIPEKFQVDHLCRVRLCVNPEHLEAVTQAENLARQGVSGAAKKHAAKERCPKCDGPFTVVKSTNRRGSQRLCKPCNAAYKAEWARRKEGGSH